MRISGLFFVCVLCSVVSMAHDQRWQTWPPTDYLVASLVDAVPDYLDSFHEDTGRFGTEPWICRDQNRIYPLAVAWAYEHPDNPYYQDDKVLHAIARGGEALVDAMDADGKWTFRKKDNSTWGQIHMPWTYSRWIRAYVLVRDALPEATRAKWEEGLLLGFEGIRGYMDGGTHNIPTHHAMALSIAGEAFDKPEWQDAAAQFMKRVVEEQDPTGFWSENKGPVVGYNRVYMEALGIYYARTDDDSVLEALRRAAQFHASILWPDGSAVSAIDERQLYHAGVDTGNVGFSWTPEGRGFLLSQVWRHRDGGKRLVNPDYAATMLLDSGKGEGLPLPSAKAGGTTVLGDNDALMQWDAPWYWAFSAYTASPSTSRWIQDRQNMLDVYHKDLGLVIGGGNTKLQPYWSTFTAGDPSLLFHSPGDESPDFVPHIELQWTADKAQLAHENDGATLTLSYGELQARVTAKSIDGGSLQLHLAAPKGKGVEGHIPFLRRSDTIRTAMGENLALNDEEWQRDAEAIGEHIVISGLKVTVPDGASLRWPARQHNPYKKDGSSNIGAAKLVLVLPFAETDAYTVELSKTNETP